MPGPIDPRLEPSRRELDLTDAWPVQLAVQHARPHDPRPRTWNRRASLRVMYALSIAGGVPAGALQ